MEPPDPDRDCIVEQGISVLIRAVPNINSEFISTPDEQLHKYKKDNFWNSWDQSDLFIYLIYLVYLFSLFRIISV